MRPVRFVDLLNEEFSVHFGSQLIRLIKGRKSIRLINPIRDLRYFVGGGADALSSESAADFDLLRVWSVGKV